MLNAPDSASAKQPVLLLRLSDRWSGTAAYREALAYHGLDVVECTSTDAAEEMIQDGCRVGLLVLTAEAELDALDRIEHLACNARICWVALVAEHLVGKPRMRAFIGDHLFNFITVPAATEHIVLTLRHAWGMAFMREMRHEPGPLAIDEDEYRLVGTSSHMQQLRSRICKIASVEAPVLLCGPSGSGKELTALAIHRQSARGQGPFVAVNCGAIPAQRFGLELFGPDGRSGRIAAAHGGTLYLDAVTDLPPEMQASLLRFLNENTVVGADGNALPLDVRVMAASSANLAEAVRLGRFRDDLYYRLNVMCLTTPRLADRGQDVEAIARHYFARFARAHNRSLRGFSKAAMNAMLAHTWPGNVRELVNRVQRATVMAEGRFIQPEDLGLERQSDQGQLLSLEDARAAAERAMIRRALAQSRNQISRAATLLGVSRVTLYRLIEKYNIRPDKYNLRPDNQSLVHASMLASPKNASQLHS